MSGHSKWHKLKHKKAVTDSKKSRLFAQLSRDIISAARQGREPATNSGLRQAVERARQHNVPQTTIDRLLATGNTPGNTVTYEGYTAQGIALLICAVTNNPNRTVAIVRSLLKEYQASLGGPNSVRWKFVAAPTADGTTRYEVPTSQQVPVATPEAQQQLQQLTAALLALDDIIAVYTDATAA